MGNIDIQRIKLRGLKDGSIEAKVEEICRKLASENTDLILKKYKELPQSREGKYINSDLMKMVFPFYAESAENRKRFNLSITNSAAILAAEAYKVAIEDPKIRRCIFIAGPYGAGKTYFAQSLFEGEKDFENLGKRKSLIGEETIVYEGSITLPAFSEKVKAAIEHGVQPSIIVLNPTLELSMKNIQERAKQTGRDVTKQEVICKYQELYSNLKGLLEEFDIPYVIYNKENNKTLNLSLGSQNIEDLQHGTKEEISKQYDRIKEKLEFRDSEK